MINLAVPGGRGVKDYLRSGRLRRGSDVSGRFSFSCKPLHKYHLTASSQQPCEIDTVIIIPRKLMLREVKQLAQGHTVSGRARFPNQVYLMLDPRPSPHCTPLIEPSASVPSGSWGIWLWLPVVWGTLRLQQCGLGWLGRSRSLFCFSPTPG